MSTTRVAKGTAQAKTSGTTLTLSSVAVATGRMMLVSIVYDSSQGNPTVTWGGKTLNQRVVQGNATAGIRVAIFLKRYVHNGRTSDVVATWSSAIGARAMFVTELNGVNRVDKDASRAEPTTTTDPATGQTAELAELDDFVVCAFGGAGPSSDTPADTADIEDADTFESASFGQRVGTVGAPPASNVTIQETFLEISQRNSTRGRILNATSRLWANALVALRLAADNRVAIGPHDLEQVREIFNASPAISHENMAFFWNADENRWEVYDRGAAVSGDTLVAYYEVDGVIGWTTV